MASFLPALPAGIAQPAYVVPVVVLSAWLVWYGLRRLCRSTTLGTPAVRVAALAAAGCTAYSADTSWRFAADYLHMDSTAERSGMFAAAELTLFALALMARQNLNGPNRAPGAPGVLVWVVTGVQVIPAFAESGPVGGTVRALVGPVMAAVLWHLAMGIELRHNKPDAASYGLAAVVGREVRERLLSRLGIAERDRDAAQITRDRATARAVALAARLADKSQEQRGRWHGRWVARRLSVAVARASVGTDHEQRRKLLDQLAARRHAEALATVDLPSPWAGPGPDPVASALAAQTRQQMRRATEAIRQRDCPKLLFADIVTGHRVNSDRCSPEHPTPDEPPEGAGKLGTAEAQTVIETGWVQGLSIRETARRATRAPSYVHGQFVKLEEERGPRPTPGQNQLINGHGEPEPQAVGPARP
ncbi:hypothetical protein ACFP1Z_05385 [Streptomyces gamaensis]|uniref:DUF2637 domain-containing protein n=1 Tax=Streptomyces gamaensis TaxID=1763542 RepID=A0ABW0YVV8_9ACTN